MGAPICVLFLLSKSAVSKRKLLNSFIVRLVYTGLLNMLKAGATISIAYVLTLVVCEYVRAFAVPGPCW